MKKIATIQREIRRLRHIVEKSAMPERPRSEAYEAYHALRWAIGDLDARPSTLIVRFT